MGRRQSAERQRTAGICRRKHPEAGILQVELGEPSSQEKTPTCGVTIVMAVTPACTRARAPGRTRPVRIPRRTQPGTERDWGSVRVGGKPGHCRPGRVRLNSSGRHRYLAPPHKRGRAQVPAQRRLPARRRRDAVTSGRGARACAAGAGPRGLRNVPTTRAAGVGAAAIGRLEIPSRATQKPQPPPPPGLCWDLGASRQPPRRRSRPPSSARRGRPAHSPLPWPGLARPPAASRTPSRLR